MSHQFPTVRAWYPLNGVLEDGPMCIVARYMVYRGDGGSLEEAKANQARTNLGSDRIPSGASQVLRISTHGDIYNSNNLIDTFVGTDVRNYSESKQTNQSLLIKSCLVENKGPKKGHEDLRVTIFLYPLYLYKIKEQYKLIYPV